MDPEKGYRMKVVIGMISLFVALYVAGDFIGCFNMVGGSATWCEPIVAFMGW